jgi:hypothetical protein
MRVDWSNWQTGDCVFAPGLAPPGLEQAEVLRRVAASFRRVVIDWPEGDRWVDARVAKAVEIGYNGFLLEAERSLRGHSVLVSVADEPGPNATWLQFYMTSDAGMLELHYEPASAIHAGRALAGKLAALLHYQFEPAQEGEKAGPVSPADGGRDAGSS